MRSSGSSRRLFRPTAVSFRSCGFSHSFPHFHPACALPHCNSALDSKMSSPPLRASRFGPASGKRTSLAAISLQACFLFSRSVGRSVQLRMARRPSTYTRTPRRSSERTVCPSSSHTCTRCHSVLLCHSPRRSL
jgi:hypothetical protein